MTVGRMKEACALPESTNRDWVILISCLFDATLNIQIADIFLTNTLPQFWMDLATFIYLNIFNLLPYIQIKSMTRCCFIYVRLN